MLGNGGFEAINLNVVKSGPEKKQKREWKGDYQASGLASGYEAEEHAVADEDHKIQRSI